jgi:hypothetical protein
MLVLHVRELFVEHPDVVIENQRHGTHHHTVGLGPGLLNQFTADEVPERLRAIGISAARDQLIELLEQIRIDCTPMRLSSPMRTQSKPTFRGETSGGTSRTTGTVRSRARSRANMHIPDGFLATPVWAGLDATAAPAVAYLARRAGAISTRGRIPKLGVMGAFVFARI